MRRIALIALFVMACGPTAAHAQTLVLAYKSGDTYKYTLSSTANETIDVGGLTIPLKLEMTGGETVTVKSVDSQGTADVSIDLSNLVIKTTTGQTTNTTSGTPTPTISMKIGADGRILSVNGTTIGGNPFTIFSGGGGFISAVLPDKAVAVGDTWSKDYDQANPMGTGTIRLMNKSKYLRDESLKGVNAAVVETTSTGSLDITVEMSKVMAGAPASSSSVIPPGLFQSLSIKGTVTADTTTWVDPAGHRVMKSHKTGTANLTMTFSGASTGQTVPGLNGPISIKGDETTDQTPA
jgi:hypothetical protein